MGSALSLGDRKSFFENSGLGLKLPPLTGARKEHEEAYWKLLSPSACSDAADAVAGLEDQRVPLMSEVEIRALMLSALPHVDSMMDRLGQSPICQYICLTYHNGLPAQAGVPKLQTFTRDALRYVLHSVSDGGAHEERRRRVLHTLADAFQACQQVQARTIDALFGALTGRSKGLREQLLILVDSVKQQVMDRVTLKLHPHCLSPRADMGQQMPHIQSAYVSNCGDLLGLRGVAASRADRMRPSLSSSQVKVFVNEFARSFKIEEVVQTFVRDVNQTALSADRLIDLQELYRWCDDAAEEHGFDKQSIFYQDDKPNLYWLSGPPAPGSAPEKLQAAWLHTEVALEILNLCVGGETKMKPSDS
mmetsp:Transcript_2350/g.5400  ORF Transcript_2350/g.5400 Transcript_2350/m.5400 type:complete len:362 (-) Transcript_2350:78-1163(-)